MNIIALVSGLDMNDSDWSVETHSLVSFARPYFRPSRDLAH